MLDFFKMLLVFFGFGVLSTDATVIADAEVFADSIANSYVVDDADDEEYFRQEEINFLRQEALFELENDRQLKQEENIRRIRAARQNLHDEEFGGYTAREILFQRNGNKLFA